MNQSPAGTIGSRDGVGTVSMFHGRAQGPDERPSFPQHLGTMVSRISPFWVYELPKLAQSKELSLDDVYRTPEDDKMSSKLRRFHKLHMKFQSHKCGIFKSLLSLYSGKLINAIMLRMITVGIIVIIVSLLQIVFTDENRYHRAWAALSVALFTSIAGVSEIVFVRYLDMLVCDLRSLLELIVCEKVLKVSPESFQKFPESQITVLIVNDVVRFVGSVGAFLTLAPLFLSAGVFIALMDDPNKGTAVLIGAFGAAILLFFISLIFAITRLQGPVILAADNRIGLLGEALKSIHVVKFHGWERNLALTIDQYREQEMRDPVRTVGSVLDSLKIGITNAALTLILAVILETGKQPLSVARAYLFLIAGHFALNLFLVAPDALLDSSGFFTSAQRLNDLFKLPDRARPRENLSKNSSSAFEVRNYSTRNKHLTGSFDVFTDEPISPQRASHTHRAGTHGTLKIPKGRLTIITGPVGSGKSTLISALQGSYPLTAHGHILSSKGLTVSSVRRHWTFKGTIRENVLFGRALNTRRYEEIVDKCRLNLDFNALSEGDLTIIGDGARTLSGGQRARLSLARCLYTDADAYLLDDVLSNVDGYVASQIFCYFRKLANGSSQAKTIVLSSSDMRLLPRADAIIYIKEDGSILSGKFESLLEDSDFQTAYEAATSAPELEPEMSEVPETYNPPTSAGNGINRGTDLIDKVLLNHVQLGTAREAIIRTSTLCSVVSDGLHLASYDAPDCGSQATSSGGYNKTFQGLWSFVAASPLKARLLLGSAILMNSFQISLAAFRAILLMWMVESESWSGQLKVTFLMLFALLIELTFSAIATKIWGSGVDVTLRHIHRKAVIRLFHAPMSYFATSSLGGVMSILSSDWKTATDFMRARLWVSITLVVSLVVHCGIFLYYKPMMGVFLMCAQVFVVACLARTKGSRYALNVEAACSRKATSSIMELIQGIETFVDNRQGKWALSQVAQALDDRSITHMLRTDISWASTYAMMICLGPFLMLAYVMLSIDSSLKMAQLATLLTIFDVIQARLEQFSRVWDRARTDSASISRFNELAMVPQEPYSGPGSNKIPGRLWRPTDGKLEFRNVSFRYSTDSPLVLKDFSMLIKGGEKVGICGRTGAGKTTIINTIFRFSGLSGGQVLIDDADIFADLTLDEVRSALSIIPQQNVLFRGTIRSNLDPRGTRVDEELWDALRRSGFLRVTSEPVHLDSPIEAEGEHYSEGERQLLALARALVRRSKILLLDEATAALDDTTDKIVQETIKREFANCTVISVAHRIQTIVKHDKVLAIAPELGSMEFGPPKELYERHGIFRDMCEDAGIEEVDF